MWTRALFFSFGSYRFFVPSVLRRLTSSKASTTELDEVVAEVDGRVWGRFRFVRSRSPDSWKRKYKKVIYKKNIWNNHRGTTLLSHGTGRFAMLPFEVKTKKKLATHECKWNHRVYEVCHDDCALHSIGWVNGSGCATNCICMADIHLQFSALPCTKLLQLKTVQTKH